MNKKHYRFVGVTLGFERSKHVRNKSFKEDYLVTRLTFMLQQFYLSPYSGDGKILGNDYSSYILKREKILQFFKVY